VWRSFCFFFRRLILRLAAGAEALSCSAEREFGISHFEYLIIGRGLSAEASRIAFRTAADGVSARRTTLRQAHCPGFVPGRSARLGKSDALPWT